MSAFLHRFDSADGIQYQIIHVRAAGVCSWPVQHGFCSAPVVEAPALTFGRFESVTGEGCIGDGPASERAELAACFPYLCP